MKHLFLASIAFLIAFVFLSSCKGNQAEQKEANSVASFKIWGNCEMCKETIEESLTLEGVAKADWSPKTKLIEVAFDSTKISLNAIQKAIAAAGYEFVHRQYGWEGATNGLIELIGQNVE